MEDNQAIAAAVTREYCAPTSSQRADGLGSALADRTYLKNPTAGSSGPYLMARPHASSGFLRFRIAAPAVFEQGHNYPNWQYSSRKSCFKGWLTDHVRFQNAPYLRAPFLSQNNSWKIIAANKFLHHNHYCQLKSVVKYRTPERQPGSLLHVESRLTRGLAKIPRILVATFEIQRSNLF